MRTCYYMKRDTAVLPPDAPTLCLVETACIDAQGLSSLLNQPESLHKLHCLLARAKHPVFSQLGDKIANEDLGVLNQLVFKKVSRPLAPEFIDSNRVSRVLLLSYFMCQHVSNTIPSESRHWKIGHRIARFTYNVPNALGIPKLCADVVHNGCQVSVDIGCAVPVEVCYCRNRSL